jgi:hypothetical protein
LQTAIQQKLQLPLRGRQDALDSCISLARSIYRAGKCLEKRLHDVMGFIPIQQFQVQIASSFVDKRLEKLPRQPEPKR